MTEHEPNPRHKRRAIPLENIVAPLVFIIGGAGSIILLRRFTGLPFLAAVVLGVIGFPIVALGGLWLFSRRR
jgi:hypothetical protein